MPFLQTIKEPWRVLRASISSSDSALTAFGYNSWPGSNVINGIHLDPNLKDVNGFMIAAYGTDAAGKTLTSYKFYGRAKMNGPILLLLTGIMTLGTQACPVDPVSGATLVNAKWVDDITVTGGLLDGYHEIMDQGNNMITLLQFDNLFFDDLYLEVALNNMVTFAAIITGM